MTIWPPFFSELGTGARPVRNDIKIKNVFMGIREMALVADPATLGVKFHEKDQVWVAQMEWASVDTDMTLVCLLDGTTHLYFGNRGGLTGLERYNGPREAGRRFVLGASKFLSLASPTETYPFPSSKGEYLFYLRTSQGIYKASAFEDDLINGKSSLSPLFDSAQEVMAQIEKTQVL